MIRLIIVIIILAILSISAYAKMLNFQSDARRATLKTMAATIHSVSGTTYTKAVIQGTDHMCRYEEPDSSGYSAYREDPTDNALYIDNIFTCYGYPTAHIDNVKKAFNLDSSLYVTNTSEDGGLKASIFFSYSDRFNYHCRVIYSDAKMTANTTRSYKVEIKDSGC